ncbi:MAG: hypothetical protein KKE20_00300 [Nanoarchaeota archaeon]|nr:hypothetical protein [Nanoarchaeota archaeon]
MGSIDISIINKQKTDDIFMISVREDGVEWSMISDPIIDYTSGLAIKSGSRGTTRLLLKDKGLMPSPKKPYSLQLEVRSLEEQQTASAIIPVFILNEVLRVYDSDINITPTIPRYMDPRNIYSFKIALYNNNPKDIKNLKLILDSNLVKKEANVQLEPDNRKVIDFTVDFDPEMKPVLDTLSITVMEGNETLYKTTMPIEIVGYRMGFAEENQTESFFLKYKTTITLTNEDNVDEQQTFLIKKKTFDYFFTDTYPDARIEERDGKKYYLWDIKLAPDESTSIIIDTNHRIPFYLLIIMIIAGVVYYFMRDPLVLIKNCDVMGMYEGGINEMKVVLVIKNRRNEPIKNVRLVDMVPKLAHIDPKKAIGTLHPQRKINTAKGLALEWNFDMDAKEERLVSYYMKSKLSILGGLRLPRAVVTIQKGNEKQRIRSNDIHIAGK